MQTTQEMRARRIEDHASGPLYHGGDLAAARRQFPNAPEPWIDLSTGINPYSYPLPPLASELFTRLPDAESLGRLEAAAARRYRALGGAAGIVAAPGTQALIQLLPALHKALSVGILGFTYGEYAQVWRMAGLVPQMVDDLDALARHDFAIVVNPNNPDGRLVPPHDLAALAAALARNGGLLVVDEAFMDLLVDAQSLVPILPQKGALVLRSVGKSYGLPGMRLGFAIGDGDCIARLRALLGPWAVSGVAIEIGRTALADDIWLSSLRDKLAGQAKTIHSVFSQCGATLIGGTPLFQLFMHQNAEKLFALFGREGILLRRFPERPNWLRVGLVGDADAERLEAAVTRIKRRL